MKVRPLRLLYRCPKAIYGRSASRLKRLGSHLPAQASAVLLVSVVATLLVGGVKQLGGVDALELRAYDQMMRLRPDEGVDPRLLLVAVTEDDLRIQQRSTLSDQTIAEALAILQSDRPAVIGLDIYRDLPQPPGNEALQTQLQAPNLIAITKLGDDNITQVPPPPGIPTERIGFNDIPIDPDGVVRRALLFGGTNRSFALQLALHYLQTHGIQPKPSPANPQNMQLGQAIFVPLEADSGGYQTNDPEGYQMLLDYRNRHRAARQVTLEQVLSGQLSPEWVKDKIVLFGTTAASSRDLFYTPYSAGEVANHQMPGVEVHAQMVSQILSAAVAERSLFGFFPNWAEWLWLWSWAIAGGSLAASLRHPIRLGLSGSGLLIALAGTSFLLFLSSVWVPVVAPILTVLLTAGTIVAYQAQQSYRQQQMVMTLLGQNTSKEIADALWKNRDRLLNSGKLPGQRLTATMLFTDIKNFSTISESISPETLLDWLNEYLGAMAQEIQRHQGIINKFTGDGLLAVFGVPVPRVAPAEVDRDAYHAVACALAMGDRLAELNQSWQQQGLPVIQMRVGISTGSVVVGSLGGKDRMEYGVIGDHVNTAARLESCAKDRQVDLCRILVSGETVQHVQGKFMLEAWGPMPMKGKQNSVDVYRVIQKEFNQAENLDII